jgi:hemoglobin-like flavoprotein
MTAVSIDRIHRSYQQMAPHAERLTTTFYERLFRSSPGTRQLFTGDMAAQGRHLAAALALVVRNAGRLDTLEQPLRDLGAAHALVGVLPPHYPVVCDAMLAALADALADAWSDELAADWRALLEVVSGHMLAGARDAIA